MSYFDRDTIFGLCRCWKGRQNDLKLLKNKNRSKNRRSDVRVLCSHDGSREKYGGEGRSVRVYFIGGIRDLNSGEGKIPKSDHLKFSHKQRGVSVGSWKF